MPVAHAGAKSLLEGVETHLVMSPAAELTMSYETDIKPKAVRQMADVFHPVGDIGASISSGSFPTMGMLIVPCSIHTMSEIAYGITDSLLSRAADVVLKERRRLVLMLRETPLHLGHIRSMAQVTEIGAIVARPTPPALAYFSAVRNYALEYLRREPDAWLVDQAALYCVLKMMERYAAPPAVAWIPEASQRCLWHIGHAYDHLLNDPRFRKYAG